MLSQPVLREIKRVSISCICLTAIMLIVFLIIKKFDLSVLYGALLGCMLDIVNFLIMSYSVELTVKKTQTGAKSFMGFSYILRLSIIAVVIYWAIKVPSINYVAAIIPLIFTRISIYILTYLDNKKEVNKA